jgi:orotidine-5'-phosphate decarboxylase
MEIFAALDVRTLEEANALVRQLIPEYTHFKIGLELCTKYGLQTVLSIFHQFPDQQFHIFVDLKFHDIPHTMGQAVEALKNFPTIEFATIHASAGLEALITSQTNAGNIKLLGVSVLTSMDENTSYSIYGKTLIEQVLRCADIILEAHLYGIVCSGLEAQILRTYPKYDNLKLICPGFRLEKTKLDDQTRIITPKDTIELDIDYLVVGRPIIQVADPRKSGLEILHAITN